MKIMVFNEMEFAPLGATAQPGFHGFYKASPRGVHLYKLTGELEAYIVNNASQGKFVVSAGTHDGRPRYMFSTSELTEKWLNMHGVGFLNGKNLIEAIRYEDRPVACLS